MTEGYCMKCKKSVSMLGVKMSKTKRGTPMAKGKCGKCGTTVCRIGGK